MTVQSNGAVPAPSMSPPQPGPQLVPMLVGLSVAQAKVISGGAATDQVILNLTLGMNRDQAQGLITALTQAVRQCSPLILP